MDEIKVEMIKQKVCGIAAVALGIASVPILEMDATAALLLIPMGLYLIFSSRICIDY